MIRVNMYKVLFSFFIGFIIGKKQSNLYINKLEKKIDYYKNKKSLHY